MAYSFIAYTGDGVHTDYVVPFPYLDKAHVGATVNGVATSFTWVNSGLIRFASAPGNTLLIRISRNSNRQARISNYQDAQVLTEAALDFDANQLFFVAQEAFDAVADAAVGGDMRRSMNLSDVNDITAARNNLGAVSKAGDTMTGALFLSGAPSDVNQAATKGYVDNRFASLVSGVASFNGRGGAVTLTSADVTGALSFTPLNKAGDTMTGPLVLSGNPTLALHAATKQWVESLVGTGGGGGTDIRPLNNTFSAFNKFLGGTLEVTLGDDPPQPAVKVSRSAAPGGPVQVQTAMLVTTHADPTSNGFEWNALFRLDNYAANGENVALYTKADKWSTGPTWGAVFEARDRGNAGGGSLYGLEIDVMANGADVGQNRQGIAIFYGPNGFGAGGTITNGLLLFPVNNDATGRMTNGVHGFGHIDYMFHAEIESGISAFIAAGTYSAPVIDVSGTLNSPIAIKTGAGHRIQFSSGTGQGSHQTWYSGSFTPTYVGALEILVDNSVLYIPVCSNHP
jgi:hypothetical protein